VADLTTLQEILGISFNTPTLLEQALDEVGPDEPTASCDQNSANH